MNKKAQLNPIAIIILIVFIGLAIFFIVRAISHANTPNLNVTRIQANVTSKGGKNLTVTPIGNITINNQSISVTADPNNKSQVLVKVVYPNSTLTPGAIMSTNITQICTSGYSASVRDVDQATKDQVFIEYKLSPDQPTGTFEVDHLIPLELGGSNDIANLWPEPASPPPGFHEKDVLENYFHKQVCDGKMKLQDAQRIMATNWFQGYVDARVAGGIK